MQVEIPAFRCLTYRDMVHEFDRLETQWSAKIKGSWSIHRHMQIFPAGRIGVPKNKFSCSTDWDMLLADFVYNVSKTGGRWDFVVRNTYTTLLPATQESFTAQPRPAPISTGHRANLPLFQSLPAPSSQSGLPSSGRSSLLSQSPSNFSFNCHDSLTQLSEYYSDEEVPAITSNRGTPTPQTTTTSRREADLSADGREVSMIQVEIARSHRCETCSTGVCYTPLKD